MLLDTAKNRALETFGPYDVLSLMMPGSTFGTFLATLKPREVKRAQD